MSTLQVPVNSTDYVQGDPHAPVTLVEYGDYECPACGAAFPIVKAVQTHFGKELRFVFRHFPLTQIHPEAEDAAETAEFAGATGFWDVADFYENQEELGLPLYLDLAEVLNLPQKALREALETRAFRTKVRSNFMGGLKSGVNGTPTFFINGKRHDGASDFDSLAGAIAAELAHFERHRVDHGEGPSSGDHAQAFARRGRIEPGSVCLRSPLGRRRCSTPYPHTARLSLSRRRLEARTACSTPPSPRHQPAYLLPSSLSPVLSITEPISRHSCASAAATQYASLSAISYRMIRRICTITA